MTFTGSVSDAAVQVSAPLTVQGRLARGIRVHHVGGCAAMNRGLPLFKRCVLGDVDGGHGEGPAVGRVGEAVPCWWTGTLEDPGDPRRAGGADLPERGQDELEAVELGREDTGGGLRGSWASWIRCLARRRRDRAAWLRRVRSAGGCEHAHEVIALQVTPKRRIRRPSEVMIGAHFVHHTLSPGVDCARLGRSRSDPVPRADVGVAHSCRSASP